MMGADDDNELAEQNAFLHSRQPAAARVVRTERRAPLSSDLRAPSDKQPTPSRRVLRAAAPSKSGFPLVERLSEQQIREQSQAKQTQSLFARRHRHTATHTTPPPPPPRAPPSQSGSGDDEKLDDSLHLDWTAPLPAVVAVEWLRHSWWSGISSDGDGDGGGVRRAGSGWSALRFDFEGRYADDALSDDTSSGLHHHGLSPERAGYTLAELTHLMRSSAPSQRAMSCNVVAHIFGKLSAAQYVIPPTNDAHFGAVDFNDLMFEHAIVIGAITNARLCADDTNVTVVTAALRALDAVVKPRQQTPYDITRYTPTMTLHEETADNDVVADENAAYTDICAGLVRMRILQRIAFIISSIALPLQIPALTKLAISILRSISMHSPQLTRRIVDTDTLLDSLHRTVAQMSGESIDVVYLMIAVAQLSRALMLNIIRAGTFDHLLTSLPVASSAMRTALMRLCQVALAYGFAVETTMDYSPIWLPALHDGDVNVRGAAYRLVSSLTRINTVNADTLFGLYQSAIQQTTAVDADADAVDFIAAFISAHHTAVSADALTQQTYVIQATMERLTATIAATPQPPPPLPHILLPNPLARQYQTINGADDASSAIRLAQSLSDWIDAIALAPALISRDAMERLNTAPMTQAWYQMLLTLLPPVDSNISAVRTRLCASIVRRTLQQQPRRTDAARVALHIIPALCAHSNAAIAQDLLQRFLVAVDVATAERHRIERFLVRTLFEQDELDSADQFQRHTTLTAMTSSLCRSPSSWPLASSRVDSDWVYLLIQELSDADDIASWLTLLLACQQNAGFFDATMALRSLMHVYLQQRGSELWLRTDIYARLKRLVETMWREPFIVDIESARLRRFHNASFDDVYTALVDAFCADQLADVTFSRLTMFTLKRRYPTAMRLRLFTAIQERMPNFTVANDGAPWLFNGSADEYAVDADADLQLVYRRLNAANVIGDAEVAAFIREQIQ